MFSRSLSTLRLRFNQWPSKCYSLHMTNWGRCVQSIEADPLNRTKFVGSGYWWLSPGWLTCRKTNLMNWHWPLFPLSSSLHFPSSFLSDHTDPLKRFSILFNCQLPARVFWPSSHLSSSSSNKTSSSKLHYIWCHPRLKSPSLGPVILPPYIVPASADRNRPRHKQYFTPASLSEDLAHTILKVYSLLIGH